MAGLAILAGCANTAPGRDTAYTSFDQDAYDAAWTTADNDDPIGKLLAQKLRRAPRTVSNYPGSSASTDNTVLAGEALNYLGIRYRSGGDSPGTGFDCSGLVNYVAEQSLGLKLPRTAAEMFQIGVPVARNDLQIGDLVFFNTMGRRYSHVGIYVGEDRFVHSPSRGGVVRIERLDMAYWNKRYNGARRIDTTLVASAHAQN
ncbi:C40 family peptidase [Bordetella sp. H567]|uniref:C40 family peptidase n=1 Tax=Bordetella sp. H567 TaxID=1697043 RepID=UPI000A720A63|nr:C40 family peptidase [Bordetella sp. H567]